MEPREGLKFIFPILCFGCRLHYRSSINKRIHPWSLHFQPLEHLNHSNAEESRHQCQPSEWAQGVPTKINSGLVSTGVSEVELTRRSYVRFGAFHEAQWGEGLRSDSPVLPWMPAGQLSQLPLPSRISAEVLISIHLKHKVINQLQTSHAGSERTLVNVHTGQFTHGRGKLLLFAANCIWEHNSRQFAAPWKHPHGGFTHVSPALHMKNHTLASSIPCCDDPVMGFSVGLKGSKRCGFSLPFSWPVSPPQLAHGVEDHPRTDVSG